MGLKLSPSNMELAFKTKPELQKYADRLMKLDRDGDGELELEEVAMVIEELVAAENSGRFLKKVAAVMAGLLLLTVVATVGLTYGIVYLTKDMKATDNNIVISKANGEPMMMGSPTLAVLYNPADAATLAELFNATGPMADLMNGAGRRLQSAADYCVNPETEALALTTAAYVTKKCKYISEDGTDDQFTLKVQPAINGECTVAEKKRRSTATCSTYRDRVQVTSDECHLFTKQVTCSTPGQRYPVGILWADSVLKTERHASYLINCIGTCGADKIVTFDQCGVARSRCMPGSGVLPANGRRLQSENDDAGATSMSKFSVYWN